MKKISLLITVILFSVICYGQTYSDDYLDTVKISDKLVINDYVLVGIQYGASYDMMMFNPAFRHEGFIVPQYYGITISKYGRMFGYLPYFGIEAGLFKGKDGYRITPDKETGMVYSPDPGITSVTFDVIEIPLMAKFHYDMTSFKLLAGVGLYGSKRSNIIREGDDVPEDIKYSFRDIDRRFDYGIKGNVGFGFVFNPFEFHINAYIKYSWNSLFEPDYQSQYYYRFAYPLDVMVTAGLYFQLTKRTGNTKAKLKREARSIVFGE